MNRAPACLSSLPEFRALELRQSFSSAGLPFPICHYKLFLAACLLVLSLQAGLAIVKWVFRCQDAPSCRSLILIQLCASSFHECSYVCILATSDLKIECNKLLFICELGRSLFCALQVQTNIYAACTQGIPYVSYKPC